MIEDLPDQVDILLVSDQPQRLAALEAILGPLGQRLVRAASGADAVRDALDQDFAVILLDVDAPDTDALRTARQLRAGDRARHAPIICLTAAPHDPEWAIQAYAAGAADCLSAPFDPAIVRSRVAVFVDVARKERLIARQHGQLLESEARFRSRSVQLEREIVERRHAELEAKHAYAVAEGARRAADEARRVAEDARRAAEEANRAKSEFLSRMSHELRTPLNSVIGFAGVLRRNRRGNLTPTDLQYIERIDSNGRHLLRLINDILDLAKIEAGKMEANLAPVSVEALVRETVGELQGRALQGEGGDPVTIDAEVPPGLEPLVTDATKLKQIVINLVGNALKFTSRGQVTVRAVADASGTRVLRLDVADTGIGIAPERLAAIFEAFEQANHETAARYGGTGLGLAISRAFAELLGYRLAVRSTEGIGSVFSVLLDPAAEPPLAPDGRSHVATRQTPSLPAPAVADRTPRVPSVLVIDDSDEARTAICEALRHAPVELLMAASGDEGLELARRHRPTVILLDLVMPAMSGWEVLRRLKLDPSLAAVPVVMISAVMPSGRAAFLGKVDYLAKPASPDEIVALASRYLPAGRRGRALVVDDDEDSRRLLSMPLVESGAWEIDHAVDGAEALQRLETLTPDLLLLDLVMPRMNGFTLLAQLRSDLRFVTTPVIVVSAKELTPAERSLLVSSSPTIAERGVDIDRLLRETLRALDVAGVRA